MVHAALVQRTGDSRRIPRQNSPQSGVQNEHVNFSYTRLDWILLRDSFLGSRAIREGGTVYAPKLTKFDNDSYAAGFRRGTYVSAVSLHGPRHGCPRVPITLNQVYFNTLSRGMVAG
jgi:hypothetical protein